MSETMATQTPPGNWLVRILRDRTVQIGLAVWIGFSAAIPFLANGTIPFDQPMLAGVRCPGTAARQRIFRAGDIDVDVKIESAEAGERITLAGQVLSGKSDFFDNAPVRLESQGVVRFRTRTNAVGEFLFEVENETYHLSIELKKERSSSSAPSLRSRVV